MKRICAKSAVGSIKFSPGEKSVARVGYRALPIEPARLSTRAISTLLSQLFECDFDAREPLRAIRIETRLAVSHLSRFVEHDHCRQPGHAVGAISGLFRVAQHRHLQARA